MHDVVIGTPSAGPIADDNNAPEWKKFVEAYKKHAERLPVAVAVRAWLLRQYEGAADWRCDKVNGDVSDGGAKLRDALASLAFDTPTGKVSLDKNRNAIADIFLTEVARERRRHALQQGRQGHPAGQPDAGHSGSGVPEARRGRPRQSELPIASCGTGGCQWPSVSVAARLQESGAHALELDGVGRHFGALVALAGISMRIAAGERRAVLGSNGAGKTTLFNAITGDFPPTVGAHPLLRRGHHHAAGA